MTKLKKSFFRSRKFEYKMNDSFANVATIESAKIPIQEKTNEMSNVSDLYDRLIVKMIEDYLNTKSEFSEDLKSLIEKIKHMNEQSKKESDNTKREINTYAFEWCQRSSIHGIPFITAKTAILIVKIFWIVLCLACWSFLTFIIISMITDYRRYEKSTSISMVYEAMSDFPAVTICNFSPFYDSKKNMDAFVAERGIRINESNSAINFTDFAADMFKGHFQNFLEENAFAAIHNLGFTLKEMLVSCEYQGKLCTYKDFYWIRDFNYGNCYRFNGNDTYQYLFDGKFHEHVPYGTLKSTVPGWRSGLRMEIFTGDPINQTQYTYKSGVRVIVHNQSIVQFTNEDGVDVSAGSQTNIAVSRTFYSRLATPFSDCVAELNEESSTKSARLADMFKLKQLNAIDKYQQKYCFKVCLHRYLIKQCNCYSPSLKFLNLDLAKYNVCGTIEQVNCQERNKVHYYTSDDIRECYTKDCPVECDSISYETKISVADYPTDWYVETMNKSAQRHMYSVYGTKANFTGPTYELVKKTTSMINIFYDSVTYTSVTESQSISFDVLLGNIGGIFGLFTGASILSFVELGDLLMSSLIIVVKSKLKK